MTKYLIPQSAGKWHGFWDDEDGAPPPPEAVAVSQAVFAALMEDSTRLYIDGEVHDAPPVPIDLYALAASLRWQKEIGGIEMGGVMITTDDRSKTLLQGARTAADANPDHIEGWKTAAGWVDLTAAQIIAMSDAVRAHVSACFALERAVAGQIADGTITTPAQVEAAFA